MASICPALISGFMSLSTMTRMSTPNSRAISTDRFRVIVMGVSARFQIRTFSTRWSRESSATRGTIHSRISGTSEEMPPFPPYENVQMPTVNFCCIGAFRGLAVLYGRTLGPTRLAYPCAPWPMACFILNCGAPRLRPIEPLYRACC